MALKAKIAKADFDKLGDAVKAEYKPNPTNAEEYLLDVEGMEDTGALKRAKDRESEEAAKQRKRADELQVERDELEKALGGDAESRARAKGDIPTLEKAWQRKSEEAVAAVTGKLTKRDQFIEKTLVRDQAEAIAARISTVPAVLIPHIVGRLKADMTGDEPVTRVLDKDGKVSALTIAELEKEFVANTDFAAIIKASDASGGGATGGKQGNGGAAKKFADMTGVERSALKKSDPARFAKESEAAKAAGGPII